MTMVVEPVALPDGRWRLNLGDGAALEWWGCRCGEPRPCIRWLGSGLLACELEPCHCDEEDLDPPLWLLQKARDEQWARIPVCRPYLSKKGKNVGLWANRCGCWGRRRDERLPESCCAYHDGNPPYRPLLPDGSPVREKVAPARPEPRSPFEPPDDAPPEHLGGFGDEPAGEAGQRGDFEPVVPLPRRGWPIEAWSCACPTPWDHKTTGLGFHCIECHQNFKSWPVSIPHRRDWRRGPCLPAGEVRDCMTGEPTLRARVDDAWFEIWG